MAAGDTNLTMIGNLVSDPELRFTPSGAAVAKFTVASTPQMSGKMAIASFYNAKFGDKLQRMWLSH